VCINCANVASNPERVARGGGIVSNEVFLRSASRNAIYSAGDRVFNIGVRCARPL
jgi:formylglycine-generating enzyme required for sulfatase activity